MYKRQLNKNGKRTITQKFIQTGNVGYSEDIDLHRRIMGIPHTEEDRKGLTMPEIFSYPASPHLASQLDKRPINFNKMEQATAEPVSYTHLDVYKRQENKEYWYLPSARQAQSYPHRDIPLYATSRKSVSRWGVYGLNQS